MRREMCPDFGFDSMVPRMARDSGMLARIGMGEVRRRFSPEFVNRIDAVITYHPLDGEALAVILNQQIDALQRHIQNRLEDRAFDLEITPGARAFLLARGTSSEYGARELKRTILRHLTQPLAAMVESGRVPPGGEVHVDASGDGLRLWV